MNRVMLVLLMMIVVKFLPAQEFISQGATPDLYLNHRVAAKETWYALGRQYNLPPSQIAAYNKQNIQAPLEIGQTIKIPLTQANFIQDDTRVASEKLVPVYHVIQDKEWMYRISVNHNKVPIEKLEKWNSVSRDDAKAGMKLIVGYLKPQDGSAVASNNTPATPTTNKTTSPSTNTTTNGNSAQQPAGTSRTATTTQPAAGGSPGNGGFFRGQFAGQGRSQSGVAGVFKSTSGWKDGKYYALMNNVTVGTIIRITFPQTNKSVYAKVLGELPEMKESAGLALRISDAAANELGASEGKFSVNVAM